MERFIPRVAKTANPLKRPSSPSPDDNASKRVNKCNNSPVDSHAEKNLRDGFRREMKNMVAKAWENKVVIDFSYDRAVASKKQRRIPDAKHNWFDLEPRIAVDEDGIPLVAHFPRALKRASADILYRELMEFAKTLNIKLPQMAGADGEGRGCVKSYKNIPGQIAGLFKLVKAWHAIGHDHEDPVVSRDMLKSGKNFSCSLKLMSQLHLVSHRINDLIEFIDPAHFAALKELRQVAEQKHKFFQVIGADDPLLMEGREFMFNRQTPLHPDKSDDKRGWAVLVVVAPEMEGGAFGIPCLKHRMRYLHGDIILLRGRILPHEVEPFFGGQRISIAHFTHRSFWKSCGLLPL